MYILNLDQTEDGKAPEQLKELVDYMVMVAKHPDATDEYVEGWAKEWRRQEEEQGTPEIMISQIIIFLRTLLQPQMIELGNESLYWKRKANALKRFLDGYKKVYPEVFNYHDI